MLTLVRDQSNPNRVVFGPPIGLKSPRKSQGKQGKSKIRTPFPDRWMSCKLPEDPQEFFSDMVPNFRIFLFKRTRDSEYVGDTIADFIAHMLSWSSFHGRHYWQVYDPERAKGCEYPRWVIRMLLCFYKNRCRDFARRRRNLPEVSIPTTLSGVEENESPFTFLEMSTGRDIVFEDTVCEELRRKVHEEVSKRFSVERGSQLLDFLEMKRHGACRKQIRDAFPDVLDVIKGDRKRLQKWIPRARWF